MESTKKLTASHKGFREYVDATTLDDVKYLTLYDFAIGLKTKFDLNKRPSQRKANRRKKSIDMSYDIMHARI